MGAFGAIAKGLAKYGDEALDVASDVVKQAPPQPIAKLKVNKGSVNLLTQEQMLTKRTQLVNQGESKLATVQDTLNTFDELKGDVPNLKKAATEDPMLGGYIDTYGTESPGMTKIRKRLVDIKESTSDKISSDLSNVLPFTEDNPKFFGTKAGADDKARIATERGVESKRLQQHHLLSKGVTGAHYKTADLLIASGKAKPDLVVKMAKMAEDYGMVTGDGKLNIMAFLDKPHNRFHTAMEQLGIEESKAAWIKQLSKIETEEQMLKAWDDWLAGDGKYTKETAESWEGLEQVLEELTGIPEAARKPYKPKPKK